LSGRREAEGQASVVRHAEAGRDPFVDIERGDLLTPADHEAHLWLREIRGDADLGLTGTEPAMEHREQRTDVASDQGLADVLTAPELVRDLQSPEVVAYRHGVLLS
jgi:hypothetical protein